jgi:uncharacterized membrane protein YjjB (DUF3815 family)
VSNLSPENRPRPQPGEPDPLPFGSSTATTVLTIIAGVILLLPGLCTVFYGVGFVQADGWQSLTELALWFIALPTFAISAGGIAMIVRAIRNR